MLVLELQKNFSCFYFFKLLVSLPRFHVLCALFPPIPAEEPLCGSAPMFSPFPSPPLALQPRTFRSFRVKVFAFLYWVVLRDSDRSITNSMVGVFERGGVGGRVPNEHIDEEATIAREDLEKAVCHLIRPEKSREYGIIIGHHGVGKSTLVRKAVRSLESPKGVVYFLTPENLETSFMKNFHKALGYRVPIVLWPYVRRWLFGQPPDDLPPEADPKKLWDPIREKLIEVAEQYHKRHGQPAVVVIDGADIIPRCPR